MAFSFGEIIDTVESRAFWCEPDEYDDLDSSKLILECNSSATKETDETEQFLVIEDTVEALQFAKSIILQDYELYGKISNSKVSVYNVKGNPKLKLCISEEKNLNLSGLLTEILSKWLQECTEVTSISIQPMNMYKGSSHNTDNNSIMIRGINTNLKQINELTPPNFITGIAAGVCSWRYHKGLNYASYAIYMDLLESDNTSAQILLDFLKQVGINCSFNQQIKPITNSSYLYL